MVICLVIVFVRGFFKQPEFLSWILNELLPQYNPYPGERSVIYLDNLGVHLDDRVTEAVEAKGCVIRFLPPYSPDYNPIELTFSVLKAWIRRHFRKLRIIYRGDFGGFLRYAIEASECDRFAVRYFKHAAGGY